MDPMESVLSLQTYAAADRYAENSTDCHTIGDTASCFTQRCSTVGYTQSCETVHCEYKTGSVIGTGVGLDPDFAGY